MLPLHTIDITRTTNTATSARKLATDSNVAIMTGAQRRVVMSDKPQNPYVNVEQANAKAPYLVYLFVGDPDIREGDKVTVYDFLGRDRKLTVKKIVPYTLVINRKNRELWCDSDND